MRMARVNVYLPDELAREARAADLNLSGLTQDAVRRALSARRTDAWLDGLIEMKRTDVDVETVLAAVREALDDLETGRG
jgi:post-segregation antitoxin (ccd killing protein)